MLRNTIPIVLHVGVNEIYIKIQNFKNLLVLISAYFLKTLVILWKYLQIVTLFIGTFFFFYCKVKKKKVPQRKRKHAVFLRLRFAQPFFKRASPLYLASLNTPLCSVNARQKESFSSIKFEKNWLNTCNTMGIVLRVQS